MTGTSPATAEQLFATQVGETFGGVVSGETWLTVEICVRSDSPQAAELKGICAEMKARGLPVYVSVSKRGTPHKAG